MSLILNQQTPNSVPTPSAGKTTVFVNTTDELVTKNSDGNISTFPTINSASNTSIFFNDEGSMGVSANLTFDNTTNTVTVLGNVDATGVKTDNLYYANGQPWDLQQPAGSNTYVQYNDNNSFGASSSFTFNSTTSTLTTANLSVTGDAVISGNLSVDGNVTYVNVETLAIEDPLISVGGGPNGNALSSNDGKDRGTLLQYYTTEPVTGFMGWDNSNAEFSFGSNVGVSSDVVTFNQLGPVRTGVLLTGQDAIITDFPNASAIVSQGTSGLVHEDNIGIIGQATADVGNSSTTGIGVLGLAVVDGGTKATGVQGEATVTSSSDSGAAVGVRGYAIDTHAGGYNIGVLGNAMGSGLGNYAFYIQSGNIASIENDNVVWDLADNSDSALIFNSSGKANIFGIETTDGAEGIYTQGYLNVTGNASVGGLKTNNLYYANGLPWDLQEAAGSNTYIQYNANGNFGASSNFTFDQDTDVLYVAGTVETGNITANNAVSANFLTGTLTTAAQPNITSVGTLTGLTVGTNIIASGNITANINLHADGNVSGNNAAFTETATANVLSSFNLNVANLAQLDKIGTANGIIIGTTVKANGNISSNANIISNGGLFVTGTSELNVLNVTGTVSSNLIPTSNVTYDLGNNTNRWNDLYLSGTTIYLGGATISADGANVDIGDGDLITTGEIISSGNLQANTIFVEDKIYIGGANSVSGFTNPVLLAKAGGAQYVQAGLINTDGNGSSDFTAYGDNGNDIAGWMDMGFTGSTFNDPAYTITGQNDGYLFVQPVNGVGLGGNLVLATGDQGANRDIVFATGGFLAANEKMRLRDTESQLDIEMTTVSTSTTTGALIVGGGVGVAGNIYSGARVVATGNVTGGNLTTAGVVAATGNVTGGNLTTAGVVAATGNVSGGNLTTAGQVVATGNVTGGNLTTAGVVAATGNVSGGNITTNNQVVATGNVVGGNLVTSGDLSVTGNANVGNIGATYFVGTGLNVTANANVAGITVTGNASVGNLDASGQLVAIGNVTGGNLVTSGNLSVTGNANFGNISATNGVFTTVTGSLVTAAQPNVTSVGVLTGLVVGNGTANTTFGNGIFTATGNATAGNLTTAGVVAATGNVTGGNLTTAGVVAATGNVTGGNLTTAGVVVATGNVSGGNLTTAGVVAATGNVSGGNLTTAGNVTSSGTVVAIGNISGGNINTGGQVVATGNVTSSANVTGANLVTGGGLYVTGNATVGNINVVHGVFTGNISAEDITANGIFTANGNSIVANVSASGLIEATGNVTGGNLNTAGQVVATGNIVSSANVNASNLNVAFNITAAGNITGNSLIANIDVTAMGNIYGNNAVIGNVAYIGPGATSTVLSVPVLIAESSGAEFVQAALINTTNTGSADWIAYSDNGNDVAGWMDMGFTGSSFNDPNYTITGNNDGYIFSKAVTGTGLGGNLVIATANTGTTNDIVFATGGFLAENEVMRFSDAEQAFKIETGTTSTDTTTGALQVTGGIGVTGNVHMGGDMHATGTINGSNTVLTGYIKAANGILSTADYDGTFTDGIVVDYTHPFGRLSTSANDGFKFFNNGLANVELVSISSAGSIVANADITANGNLIANVLVSDSGDLNLFAQGTNSNINLNTTGVGTINVGNARIIWLGSPQQPEDAVTKAYVDAAVSSGLHIHEPVLVEQTSNLNATYTQGGTTPTVTTITSNQTLTTSAAHGLSVNDQITFDSTTNGLTAGYAYFVYAVPAADQIQLAAEYAGTEITSLTNGTSLNITSRANPGVGATLTNAGTQAALTVDGVSLSVNDRVLINGQTNTEYDGVYVVTTVGTGSTNWVLTRSSDQNKYSPQDTNGMGAGDYFFVQSGTQNGGKSYVLSNDGAIIIGTTPLTYTLFSDSGAYIAGTGLTLDGFTFNLANTAVTADTYGNSTAIPTFTVNQQGQLTAANTVAVVAPAGTLSGTSLNSTVVNSSLTSVGTLGSLEVTANANVGNLYSAAAVQGTVLTSNVAVGTAPLVVTSTTEVANLFVYKSNIAGYVTSAAQPNITSVGTLSSLTVSGNTDSGNVNSNFYGPLNGAVGAIVANTGAFTTVSASGQITSSVSTGTAPFVIASTTRVNNLNVASAGTADVAGTVTNNAQPNITSVGTLTSLAVTGTTTSGNFATAGNITASQLISNITAGTAPLSVVSTTRVANLNVARAGVADTVTVSSTSAGNYYPMFISSTSGNLAPLGNSTYVANVANGSFAATTFIGALSGQATSAITAGTVTTAAQPNITSVGTLTSLGVDGTITGVNITANTGVFTGNGSGLSQLTGANVTGAVAYATTANSVAGANVSGQVGNALVAGTVYTAAQPNITSVGTLTSLGVSGAVTAGRLVSNIASGTAPLTVTSTTIVPNLYVEHASVADTTAVTLVATGVVYPTFVTTASNGNLDLLSNANIRANLQNSAFYATTFVGALSGAATSATTAGTVTTAAQPNITSVGTLSSLAVTGNISAGNVNAPTFGAHNGTIGETTANTGAFTTVSASGQITSTLASGTAPFVVTSTTQVANLNVATAGVAGTVTAAAQPNITSVGTLSGLTVTSTITGSVSGSASTATTAGTVTTAAQPNITSVGTLTSLSVSGTVSATTLSGSHTGSGAGLSSLTGANVTGTVANATYAVSAGSAGTATSATTAGTVTTAAQPNITSVGTLTGLALSGSGTINLNQGGSPYVTNIQFGDNTGWILRYMTSVSGTPTQRFSFSDQGAFTATSSVTAPVAVHSTSVQTPVLTTGANTTAGTLTGNWTLSAGSRWNATYADLSEKYVADANYGPGTVLVFGGDQEVTISTVKDTTRVAGVVTTDAAYTMNSGLEAEFVADIALQGRVPCKVIGPVFKGDLLVAAENGHAIANNEARAGTIIGKSLENFNGVSGVIEVAVGRF